MKTKCMIVDDEPLAIDALRMLLEKFKGIEIMAACKDSFEALEVLQNKKIDLMFLDIQMPEVTGLNFLKSLNHPPKVILTTAYREYALDAFELDVIDYMLKPISHERLMKAINKYYEYASSDLQISDSVKNEVEEDDYLYVKSDRKMKKVLFKDILYIEGLKDYVHIIANQKNIITKHTLSELEKKLPAVKFIRIHRSCIVAMDKITAFTANEVEIGTEELPIGRSYKNEVMRALKFKFDKL
ncbi:MAG: LytTR family DNA-binding domain-containing protein [Bacteroidales bacterium]